VAENDLKDRTKMFARRVLRLLDHLPNNRKGWIVGDQLGRCGTSVGANYRAACRARSRAEFIAKLGTVIEEADESAYWLELVMEDEIVKADQVTPLWQEANEIVAIMTSSRKTAEGAG
jgi:four helix bundle protein